MAEIGSIFEINPKRLWDQERNPSPAASEEIEKYQKEHMVYTASGREAILLCLKTMEKNNPALVKKCLMPAYMCDSVFFPFLKSDWELIFYSIDRRLQADEEELESLIAIHHPGLVFVHSYFGIDTWMPLRKNISKWRERGICVMEDVTQSYYLETSGRDADFCIGSLRKWYPLPDGGFAASDMPLLQDEMVDGKEFADRRLGLLVKKWDYLHEKAANEKRIVWKEEYLKDHVETEEWLDLNFGLHKISDAARILFMGEPEEECKRRRQRNYRLLYAGISGCRQLHPVFDEEVQAAAPLYFPVYVNHREALQRFLGKRDIYAPVLWPVGEANKDKLSESEQYIYGHLLALPLDQRYGESDMQRMLKAVKEYDRLPGKRMDGEEKG